MNVRARGAVLVETALFVSATLVFMLGIIQIGVLGFLQLTTDAAAYFDARTNVLSQSTYANAEAATNHYFPQIPTTDIVPAALPAPTPTIPVDYGYNGTSSEQASAQVDRHGGAAMLQPAQEQSTVNVPGIAHFLGQSMGVTGVAVEPKWLECGTHDDIGGVACSLAPSSTSETNYFTQGENTPPYFVGFNYLQQCSAPQPWGLYTGTNSTTGTTYSFLNSENGPSSTPYTQYWANYSPCANGSNNGNSEIGFIAMGSAEFLDSANWGDKSAGVSGACDTSGGTNQAIFEAAAYHQRVFAVIGKYLSANPWQYLVEEQSQAADKTANPLNYWYQIYTSSAVGSNTNDQGKIATPESVTTFLKWEGFDDSGDYPGTGSNGGDQYNAAVHSVYSWDVSVGQGNPPSDPNYNNPTHPEAGCT